MRSIRKREYGHMQSIQTDVREICPKTGEYIEPQEIPKKLTVHHYLTNNRNLMHPLDKYKAMGVSNMTDKQIESAYNIIKGTRECRVLK